MYKFCIVKTSFQCNMNLLSVIFFSIASFVHDGLNDAKNCIFLFFGAVRTVYRGVGTFVRLNAFSPNILLFLVQENNKTNF